MYDRPTFYEMLFGSRTSDLDFYRAHGRRLESGPILELGAGTGRVALALAREGHRVVAVDREAEMLARFEDRLAEEPASLRQRVEMVHADVRTMRLDRRFPLVLCPFNGIAHCHDDDALAAFLETVRRHLEPVAGRFVFDTLIPDPLLLEGVSSYVPWFRHPETGCVCRVQEDASYDGAVSLLTLTTTLRSMEGEAREERLELKLRLHQPEELPSRLLALGFEVLDEDRSLGDVIAWACRPIST